MKRSQNLHKIHTAGFTLIELLVVIAIIGILSSVVLVSLNSARNKAYYARAQAEFRQLNNALELYIVDNNGAYPDDRDRDIGPGLEQYIAGGGWPDAPWPGSLYDWDNWKETAGIVQFSIRFCDYDGLSCNYPDEEWADGFGVNSAV